MRSKPLILAALLLAAFLVNLDTTLVNVALPALTRELHATTTQLQWVVDAYNLVFAALLLTFGSLSDRFGRKGMLLAGLAVVGAASLAGGFTTSAAQLIAARAVMGLGAAMTFPATLSLLTNVFTGAAGTGPRDRPVGRGRRRRHRDGPDRRRLAARPLQLGQRLRRHGPGRGARHGGHGGRRSGVEEPGGGAPRRSRPRAVVGDDGAARLHDHRGARPTGGPPPAAWRASPVSRRCSRRSSRPSGGPRTRCSTCGSSATGGSARRARRSRCRSSPCSASSS